jgi:thiamine biosynthesis lipoprotein
MKRFCALLLLLSFGCREGEVVLKRTQILMGTVVEIKVWGEDEENVKSALDAAFNEIERIDNLMSIYKRESEISLLNRLGSLVPSEDVMEVIRRSVKFSRLSRGAFDVTCKPLLSLWSRAKERGELPTQEELKQALSLVGWENLEIDGESVRFKLKGMQIDLGGVAKGFAVDRAVAVLLKHGVKRAIVNAGGDMYLLGKAPRRGGLWQIGVRNPRVEGELLYVLNIQGGAVATSGSYERYFTIDGKKYSHIIDPKTGWPVGDEVLSVTIVAPDCTTADAVATACFVLGGREGMELIERIDKVEGMIVCRGMKIVTSSNWQ